MCVCIKLDRIFKYSIRSIHNIISNYHIIISTRILNDMVQYLSNSYI